MAVASMREQLLVNVKFLYGNDVEVLTICHGTLPDSNQAIAVTFHPLDSKLTKHFHGPRTHSYNLAIEKMLQETEKEIGKLLCISGNALPFEEEMVQTLTLGRHSRESPGTPTSQQSDFIFIPTPASSIADEPTSQVSLCEEIQVQEIQVEEIHAAEEVHAEEIHAEEIQLEKCLTTTNTFQEEEEEELYKELSIEKPSSIEQSANVLREPVSVYDADAQDSKDIQDAAQYWDWSSWGTTKKPKKGKKKKAVDWFDNPSLQEDPIAADDYVGEPPIDYTVEEVLVGENSKAEDVCSIECYQDESSLPGSQLEVVGCISEEDQWGSFLPTKKSRTKRKKVGKVVELPGPEMDPSSKNPDVWGSFSTRESKNGSKFSEAVNEPTLEPEPVPVVEEDHHWGSFSFSAKKAKKGRKTNENVGEPVHEPEPEPEPTIEYGDWASFSNANWQRREKRAKKDVADLVLTFGNEPEPEPMVVEDFDWGFSTKKKKKKNIVCEEVLHPIEEPVLHLEQPAVEEESFGWGSFSTKKDKKKLKKTSCNAEEATLEPQVELQPIAEVEDWAPVSKNDDKKKNNFSFFESFEERIPDANRIPEHEIASADDPWAWPPTKKGKKKRGKSAAKLEEIQVEDFLLSTAADPEPVIHAPSWATWGSSWRVAKRSEGDEIDEMDAESSKAVVQATQSSAPLQSIETYEEGDTPQLVAAIEEGVVAPYEPVTGVEEDDWMNWGGRSKRDKKKKQKITAEATIDEGVPALCEPVPRVEEDDWMKWGRPSKKDKKKKQGTTAEVTKLVLPGPDPEREPYVEDPWVSWGALAKKQREKSEEGISETRAAQELLEDNKDAVTVSRGSENLSAGVSQEEVNASAAETSRQTLAISLSATPKGGQTIVFTIRYPNLATKARSLEVMLKLSDNTRAAIFEAVNAYLNSRDVLHSAPRQRTLQIRSGVGRNGEVDLSELEEVMWPSYIEYFCQYTKLPELTVDVMNE